MQTYTAVGSATVQARETARHRVVIIGGGTAGVTVAAQLARKGIHDVAIIEPSPKHYYQPLWTLVGAGVVPVEQSVRDEARYIPKGVRWIQDYAVEI
ncbi:MAG: FAD-dependent oxidoreductase, partial [Fimbriimonadales bacterium]